MKVYIVGPGLEEMASGLDDVIGGLTREKSMGTGEVGIKRNLFSSVS